MCSGESVQAATAAVVVADVFDISVADADFAVADAAESEDAVVGRMVAVLSVMTVAEPGAAAVVVVVAEGGVAADELTGVLAVGFEIVVSSAGVE